MTEIDLAARDLPAHYEGKLTCSYQGNNAGYITVRDIKVTMQVTLR